MLDRRDILLSSEGLRGFQETFVPVIEQKPDTLAKAIGFSPTAQDTLVGHILYSIDLALYLAISTK